MADTESMQTHDTGPAIPYPRLMARADGMLALVASAQEEARLAPGGWFPLTLPHPVMPPGMSPEHGREREYVAALFLTKGHPVYLRILAQYDITLDDTVWRLEAWRGPL